MSRKSEFSNGLSFESPGVQGELPHHGETLSWRSFFEVFVGVRFPEFRDACSFRLGLHDLTAIITLNGRAQAGYQAS